MPIVVSWSSGKDSAWVLHRLLEDGEEVAGLFAVLAGAPAEVPMHAVPEWAVQAQADALGLPLFPIHIPDPCTEEHYATIMTDALRDVRERGVDTIAFGDLYLEEVRRRREERMAGTGMGVAFPIWGTPVDALPRDFTAAGFRARITSVDTRVLPASAIGTDYDQAFLDSLPAGVDPCGENGEFHTVVYDGPIFDAPVPVTCAGCTVTGDFAHAKIVPGAAAI